VRDELKTVSAEAQRALLRAADRATRAHLEEVRDQIAKALDPKFIPPQPALTLNPFGRQGADEGEEDQPSVCWPDYAIRPPRR
jgi:hypothetical protein